MIKLSELPDDTMIIYGDLHVISKSDFVSLRSREEPKPKAYLAIQKHLVFDFDDIIALLCEKYDDDEGTLSESILDKIYHESATITFLDQMEDVLNNTPVYDIGERILVDI